MDERDRLCDRGMEVMCPIEEPDPDWWDRTLRDADSGKFTDATYEQLELAYKAIDCLPGYLLPAYLSWVNGNHNWEYGTEYALSGWRKAFNDALQGNK